MGGCVSTPKDFAVNEGEAPVEVPTSPKKADGETVAQVLFLSFLSFSFNHILSPKIFFYMHTTTKNVISLGRQLESKCRICCQY